MNWGGGRMIIFLYKKYNSHTLFLKWGLIGVFVRETVRQRETKSDCYIDLFRLLLLTIPHCVIFRTLQLWLFCFPARGHCRLLPHQEPGGQSLWLATSKPKTLDWRMTLQNSLHLLWAAYIWFHNAHIFWMSPTWCASANLHRCILQSYCLHSWDNMQQIHDETKLVFILWCTNISWHIFVYKHAEKRLFCLGLVWFCFMG